MYVQVGAMMGTIMAWNVYFVIMPSQRKLVEAKERSVAPDPVYGLRGKQRSVHNNYFTLPVLFIMISNHYPMTFGYRHAWLVLIAILLLAAFVRHFFNLRHKGRTVWAIPVTAALATLLLAIAIAPEKPEGGRLSRSRMCSASSPCAARRATRRSPRSRDSTIAPKGFLLDTPELIVANAQKINEQAVVSKVMPIGNLTGMTDARARDARRVDCGRGAGASRPYESRKRKPCAMLRQAEARPTSMPLRTGWFALAAPLLVACTGVRGQRRRVGVVRHIALRHALDQRRVVVAHAVDARRHRIPRHRVGRVGREQVRARRSPRHRASGRRPRAR